MKKIYLLLYSFLLICLFLVIFFRPITAINEDLGRHILLGRIILTTHTVPKTNLLSYTYPNFPFINSSWLSELIFFFITKIGGFNLLLIISTLTVALAISMQIAYALKKYTLGVLLTASTLYLLLLSNRSDVRPEIFSMLFLSVFIVTLYSCKERMDKRIFLLLPIEVLWVNMHIYFFVGPLLITLFLIDDLISNKFQFRTSTKLLSLTLLGTFLAVWVNPNGINGALFPVTVLQNYGLPISENQSIATLYQLYRSSTVLFPLIAIIALFLILFLGKKNTRPVDWLLAIVFSLSVVIIFRNILLFVFATFLPFTSQLDAVVKIYNPKLKKLPPQPFFIFYPLSLVAILLFSLAFANMHGFGFGVVVYGKGAGDFLIKNKIAGPVFNDFNMGGYLAYRIYPDLVFVDNRPEAYPKSFFQQTYLPVQDNPNSFKTLDEKYHFNALILGQWDSLPWGDKLVPYLVNNPNYALTYLDPYAFVLIRKTRENKQLIDKYQLIKNTYHLPSVQNTDELIHYYFFFTKVGWTEQANETVSHVKTRDPHVCVLKKYPLLIAHLKNNTSLDKLQGTCAQLPIGIL